MTSPARRARFEALAPELVDPLRRFLARRTDAATADDALGETLLVCWRRLDEVPEGAPLYVHCQSGVRSAVASALLASEGYDVRYVNDGFPHYREIADDVETEAPADATA